MSKFFVLLLLMFTCLTAHSLCVNTSDAILRSGPGKKYPATWKVSRHTPLLDLELKNGWYKVQDQDGANHWIYKSYVTGAYQCMSIMVTNAALRTGPGTDKVYAELASVGKYYPFKRLDFDPPWYQVEDERKGVYWVHENLVWKPMKRQNIKF